MCVSLQPIQECPQGPEESIRSPEAGVRIVSCSIWVLGTKLMSSVRATGTLNYGAISPAP